MKIIAPGKKEFVVVCPTCGCKFSYTIEEFRSRWPLQYMLCPDCENSVYHPNQNMDSQSLSDFVTENAIKNALNKTEKDARDYLNYVTKNDPLANLG